MKIVEAFWEQRNLGVTCTEVSLDESDTIDILTATLASLHGQYLIIKVPIARFDLMTTVEKAGFSFIEGSMNVVHHLKNIQLSGIQKRLNDSILYEEMDQADIARLYDELRRGIFVTDRVYLDTAFTKEQAAQRYEYWIEDECGRGAQLYKLVYKSQAIGFFIFKETSNGGCYPFLAGLYESTTTPGGGNVLVHKIIEEASRRGLKFISSFISTNNLPVIKVHLSEGFTIAQISYVYIKHN
jgi:L-amino acid N-acyltransferase YncA